MLTLIRVDIMILEIIICFDNYISKVIEKYFRGGNKKYDHNL